MKGPAPNRILRPYMAWCDDDPREGAALAWAYTHREARKLAAPIVQSWAGCEYTDVRVRWLEGETVETHFLARKGDAPHVIESPPICDHCDLWGKERSERTGVCQSCLEDMDDEA